MQGSIGGTIARIFTEIVIGFGTVETLIVVLIDPVG